MIEHEIKKKCKEIEREPKYFSGIAFISFEEEEMKNIIIEDNQHSFHERIHSFFNGGKMRNFKTEDLVWKG